MRLAMCFLKRIAPIVLGLMLVMILVSGCFSLSAPELSRVRSELERQLPEARFEREIELSLGRITLGAVKWLCLVVPDVREAREYLRDINGISVAVYDVHSLPPLNDLEMPERLQRQLEENGWEVLVKVREEDEILWIFYQEHRGAIRNMYVVALESDELVLVRLRGRLDGLFDKALEESDTSKVIPGMSFD